MKVRIPFVALVIVVGTLAVLSSAHAVPATNFTLDKTSYNPGDSGTASITFYNDQGVLIRITSVDLLLSYYYQDGRVYSQDFVTPALTVNVTSGTSSLPLNVQFNLPSSLATGYFTPTITVTYSTLNGGVFNGPNQDTSRATAPLLVASASTQTMTYLFVATTLLFAILGFYFAARYWSAKKPESNVQSSRQ